MTMILAEKSRGKTFTISPTQASGSPVAVGSNDLIRIIIGHEGRLSAAPLTLVSGTNSANGSSITVNVSEGTHRIRLDADDLAFDAGTYTMVVDFFDNADAEEWKTIDRQVFHLEDT